MIIEINSTAYCQVLNHVQQDNVSDRPLCPGEVVVLTCRTRGSSALAWTSDEYIEPGGTRIEFGTFNDIGQTKRSPINPNTVATLTRKTSEDGMDVLVSELRIITRSQFLNSSVTCIHVRNGTMSTRIIQVLGTKNLMHA